MDSANTYIKSLISDFREFVVEGFNVFGTGKDNLPHVICACPNKATALAIHALLMIAKKSHDLQEIDREITSNF